MAEIFVCPKKSISERSVRALRESGIIVVQADDPKACRFIRAGEEITGSQMLRVAMDALCFRGKDFGQSDGGTQRKRFADAFYELIQAKQPKPDPPPTAGGGS